jgi:hypothetical protein
VFSRKRHWISWTRFRPDPTRPDLDLDLDLGAQFSYRINRIPRPDPLALRPDPKTPFCTHSGEGRSVFGAFHTGSHAVVLGATQQP